MSVAGDDGLFLGMGLVTLRCFICGKGTHLRSTLGTKQVRRSGCTQQLGWYRCMIFDEMKKCNKILFSYQ